MAITFEAYAKNNLCYKAARTMPTGSPAGIIIHSTGANNPNLKRYVNAPEICGENPYRNYFDRPDSNVCPHAVIGKDKNGEVKAAKLLPWNVCCWGCGSGSKGSYNYSPAYIQIEIAEDALNDRAYFEEAFGLAADLCQRLMKNYPTIKPGNIISHKEACARGYASNHGDPENWLARFGKNMDWFRSQVAPEKQVRITAEISVGQSKAEELSRKLRQLGCSVKIE
ncbi:MAG: N-acetylmuramoyl-L-alanine amidase [Oscillospiraceae bacterium]